MIWKWPDRINFPLALTLVFLLLGFIGIVHHEMWRDELQAWMIARDNTSLASLASTVKYEGHPMTWYLCLYAITRFTHNPFAMQVLHILIASFSIWVFARFAPFTKLQKVLFAFGFYPFYEYAIKSRGYALGILLVFIFCALYKDRSKRYILLSCVLFLLCQTSFLGVIIAASLQAMLIFEVISDGDFRKKADGWAFGVMLLISLAGAAVALWQIVPPADSTFDVGWYLHFDSLRAERFITVISRAYLCSPYYWFFEVAPGVYQDEMLLRYLFLSAALFLFLFFLFLRKPKVLFLYIFSLAAFLSFFYLKYGGFSWHHGHIYILLIVCFWLAAFYPDTPVYKRYAAVFLTMILAIHFYQGARTYIKDYSYPFSAAKEAAQYIKNNINEDVMLVGEMDTAVSPIAGYLDRPIYYLRQGRFATYVKWDAACRNDYDVRKFPTEPILQGKKFLFILNGDLRDMPGYITKIKEFKRSMVPDEKYCLYAVNFT